MSEEAGGTENADVFVYMGEGEVPRDVVWARVHPSVTIIPERAFAGCNELEEIELCQGLLEIGRGAFFECKSLKRINVPSTVVVIRRGAFEECENIIIAILA